MATDVSIRVGVDGEKEFRSALNGINSQIRNLNSEMKSVVSGFTGMDNAEKKTAQQTEVLGRKMEATKQKISVLTAEYDRQKAKLNQLGNELDQLLNAQNRDEAAITKTTNAYNRQQTVVNNLGRQINDATADMNRMEQEMDDLTNGAKETANALDDAGDKASGFGSKVSSGFTVLKGIAANVIADGIQAIASSLTSLAGEAVDAADSLTKFESTMSFAGFSTDEINSVSAAMQEYASRTVYDLQTVANTVAQLGANGVADYEQLTEAAGNLNAVAGGNADTFRSVAMVLTQTAGAGKLTTENWNQLADAIPGASGLLQEAMRENGAYVGNFREAMEDGEITADEFNQAIMDLGFSEAAQEAATSTSTIESAIGNLKATIVDAITGILTEGGGMAALVETINGITTAVQSLITAFQEGGLQGLFEQIGLMFQNFISNLQANMPTIMQAGFQMISSLVQGITQGIPTFIQSGVMLITTFIQNLIANIPLLLDAGLQFVSGLVQGIVSQIPQIIPAATQTFTTFLNTITSSLPEFLAKGSEILTNLANGIISAIPQLVGQLPQIISSIINFIVSNLPQVIQTGVQLLTSFAQGIISAIPQLVAQIPQIIASIVSTIASNLPQILQSGVSIIQSLIQGILSLIGSVGTAIGNIASTIVNGIMSLPGQVLSIGSQIVQGLINGITSGISRVANAIGNLASSAISRAKSALGIASPSRVFRDQVGLMIARGMALGISKGEKDVLHVADRLNDKLLEKEEDLNAELERLDQEDRDRKAAEELADYQQKIKEKYAELEKAEVSERQKIQQEISELEADWNEKQLEAQKEAEKEKLEAQIKTLEDFKKEYQSALDEIEKSQESMAKKLKDYGDLFETVKTETGSFLELGDLEEDINAIQRYGDALEQLKARGVSDSLMDEIVGMSVDDATAYTEQLLSMTDDQYTEYMALWEQKQAEAQQIAKKFYSDEMDALQSEFVDKIPDELGEVKDEMRTIGVDGIQGMIDGMYSRSGALWSAASSIVSQAIAAMRAAADIHSPSKKVAEMVGVPMGEGVAVGMMQGIKASRRAIDAAIMQPISQVRPDDVYNAAAGAVTGITSMGVATTQTIIIPINLNGKQIAEVIYDPLRQVGKQRGVAFG